MCGNLLYYFYSTDLPLCSGANKDERGRVRITAPRVENPDSDEEDEFAAKRQKAARQSANEGSGLFAMLPDPKGSGKRVNTADVKSAHLDQIFASGKKKTESGATSTTIKVPTASAARYEAELKKAALIQKFLKKPKEEDDDYEQQGRIVGTPAEEADYLGLVSR